MLWMTGGGNGTDSRNILRQLRLDIINSFYSLFGRRRVRFSKHEVNDINKIAVFSIFAIEIITRMARLS